MRRCFDTLRSRLVGSMLVVFLVGLGGALLTDVFQDALQRILGAFGFALIEEPYQDIVMLVPLGLGAIGLMWMVSGLSLRRVEAASREAATIDTTNPDARISTRGLPGEIQALVGAVNGALDRLASAFALERRFVANAAHELRTPLAVLSLRLQRARIAGAPDWDAIERDLAQVNRLVVQLLDLARKEHAHQAEKPADWPVVNLARLAREAAAGIVPLAGEAGRQLDVDLPSSLAVRGRPDDLRDMVRNMLENALLHGRGTIRLIGGTEETATREACVTVCDEGPGIPCALAGLVFERFQKGTQSTAGHGLGLAIVKEVATGHGGSVVFLDGPNCRIRVALPLAADRRSDTA